MLACVAGERSISRTSCGAAICSALLSLTSSTQKLEELKVIRGDLVVHLAPLVHVVLVKTRLLEREEYTIDHIAEDTVVDLVVKVGFAKMMLGLALV